jgi:hypothetical protein
MTAPNAPHVGWLKAVEAVAPYAGSPKADWILIISLVAAAFLRLLMEWQQRRTLAEIFQYAPGGSIIVIKKRGLGGSMWVQVGTRTVPGIGPGGGSSREASAGPWP